MLPHRTPTPMAMHVPPSDDAAVAVLLAGALVLRSMQSEGASPDPDDSSWDAA